MEPIGGGNALGFNKVVQKTVQSGSTHGWSLKCTGKGNLLCVIHSAISPLPTPDPVFGSPDEIEVATTNNLIAYSFNKINNAIVEGFYNHVVMTPEGEIRTYRVNWKPVSNDPEGDYEIEVLRIN